MPEPSPRIAILPHGTRMGVRPGRIPLDALIWPLGQPRETISGILCDLGPADHLIMFPRDTMHLRPGFGTRARVSVMVMEPAAIHGHHMRLLRVTHRRFHRVLTSNETLLSAMSNGVFFPHGGTWVPEWRGIDPTKSRMCSLIASGGNVRSRGMCCATKRFNRHLRPVSMWRSWAAATGPSLKKADGLASYRYSVVIENVRERNYFTEKLIDALLCRTVPIYWGCPNIGDFMETRGMILCIERSRYPGRASGHVRGRLRGAAALAGGGAEPPRVSERG